MSYIPLARKYRPTQFSDFVGQESTTSALKNGLALGREPRCLIFTGIRGVGKTTLARLYAMALNCEQLVGSEPCNHCSNCLGVLKGNHEDVTEIDGASNTGVDDVRSVQETVSYVPQRGKYRVYIVDEVHMLSQSAFNAFLKTLEEPPANVVFIFATTELSKVPKTVQSRCQTFYLGKISKLKIKENLEKILKLEEVSFEENALDLVASEGQGSMRDALTFLDQVIAFSDGNVSLEYLDSLTVNVSSESYFQLIQHLLDKDGSSSIEILSTWHDKGMDFKKACEELILLLRNCFIMQAAKENSKKLSLAKSLDINETEFKAVTRILEKAGKMDLNRLFRTFVSCYKELLGNLIDRFVFENYCLEWCFDPGIDFSTSLEDSLKNEPMKSQNIAVKGNQESLEKVNLNQKFSSLMGATKTSLKEPTIKETPIKPPSQKPSAPVIQKEDPHISERNIGATTKSKSKIPIKLEKLKPIKLESSKLEPPEKPKTKVEPSGENTLNEFPSSKKIIEKISEFPESWRSFVEVWQREKPLQARIIEESHLISYSKELIELAVSSKSMAASRLLNIDFKNKIFSEMRSLFGFTGEFKIGTLDNNHIRAEGKKVPSSLLEVKRLEKKQKKEEIIENAKNHEATKNALSVFGGKIESVDIIDSNL